MVALREGDGCQPTQVKVQSKLFRKGLPGGTRIKLHASIQVQALCAKEGLDALHHTRRDGSERGE